MWTGSQWAGGYGSFGYEGTVQSAHRVAYQLAFGPIPDGMHVLHSCDNPPCVNPAHLHIGTHTDNMREKVSRGRDFQASQTQCKSGHPFDELNTYVTPDGRRNCRTCRRSAKRAYRARLKKGA